MSTRTGKTPLRIARGEKAHGDRPRAGFLLVEMVVAAVLLLAVVALATQVAYATARMRRAAQLDQLALQEAANTAERVAAIPYQQLDETSAEQLELSPAATRLPNATLSVTVVPAEPADRVSEAPQGRRITIEVSYELNPGTTPRTQRLVLWRWKRT
jgi:Tfp pilus assembly protein PilE